MSVSWPVGPQLAVCEHGGILLSREQDRGSDTCCYMGESPQHSALSKEPDTEGHALHNSIDTKCPE